MQHFDPGAHPYSRICCGLKDSLVPWQDAPHSCEGAVPETVSFQCTLYSALCVPAPGYTRNFKSSQTNEEQERLRTAYNLSVIESKNVTSGLFLPSFFFIF